MHWANGGPTALDNMVLLCRAHHTIIHSTGWRVRINPADRRPEFQPPATGRRPRVLMHDRTEPGPGPDRDDGWIRERTPRTE